MKFPYREYICRLPGSDDFRLIRRPVIAVTVCGPAGQLVGDALFDTGADDTLLPISFAEALGLSLDESMTSEAVGITGGPLTVFYAEVRFSISAEDDDETVHWTSTVGFVEFESGDDEVVIFGHEGCLEFFTARFDGERAELELIPNSLLPG